MNIQTATTTELFTAQLNAGSEIERRAALYLKRIGVEGKGINIVRTSSTYFISWLGGPVGGGLIHVTHAAFERIINERNDLPTEAEL